MKSICDPPYIGNQQMMNWMMMMNLKSSLASNLIQKVLDIISQQTFFIFATFIGNKSRRFPKKIAEPATTLPAQFVHRPWFSKTKGKLLGIPLY